MGPKFPVSDRKLAELRARMKELGVREEDLREEFGTSSGPGGQKVNRSKTCVLLLHVPTGTRVRCQETRSQALNRFLARRQLLDILSGERERRMHEVRRRKASRRSKARRKYASTTGSPKTRDLRCKGDADGE